MFGADTKALFVKYCLDISVHLLKQIFPEGQKSIFSVHSPAYLNHLWQIVFISVFATNYPISRQLSMDSVIRWLDNLIQYDKHRRLTS